MNPSILNTKIQNLRAKNSQTLLEAITITIVALVINSMLPLLLVKYVYANQRLLEAPPIFDYIAVVSFGITVLYFVYAFISNYLRERQIRQLLIELEASEVEELLTDEELKELEEIVDEALSKKSTKSKKQTKTKRSKASTKTKSTRSTKTKKTAKK